MNMNVAYCAGLYEGEGNVWSDSGSILKQV